MSKSPTCVLLLLLLLLCAALDVMSPGQGRDANRKLQRAIKAKKLRERLPGMLGEVRARLAEWRESEDAPFTYDGKDYEVRSGWVGGRMLGRGRWDGTMGCGRIMWGTTEKVAALNTDR
jgi:hypothetical protein